MGWDVVGKVGGAVGWLHDKGEEALDEAGAAVDSAVHTAERAVDDGRKAIVDFGERHGGVVGKALARNVSDSIGLVEGAGLAVYDAAAGVATVARGVGNLTSPVEWAMHPERNLARATTAGSVLTTMAKLGSPTAWMLNPSENSTAAKAMWNGVTGGYQEAARSGDWSKFAGRAVIDVGSFFVGAGEVNAGVKSAQGANAAAHAAQGLNAAAHTAEGLNGAAHAAEGLNGAAHAAEGLGAAAKTADGIGDASKVTDAAADAARGAGAVGHATEVAGTAGKNTMKWTVDAEGHTVHAEAHLEELFAKAPRSSAEKRAQGAAGAAGETNDVGGHIFGHRFVKDQGPVNLFPQDMHFNNSAYRTMENEWADWIKSGNEVDAQVTFSGGTPTRPDNVVVRYDVIDPVSGDAVYSRSAEFSNEAGQVFDRVPAKDMLK